MNKSRLNINILQSLREELEKEQTEEGEFRTFAVDGNNDHFYIGVSPFLAAHIGCILAEIPKKSLTKNIVRQLIKFLKKLDPQHMGLFKFWYGEVNKTSFLNLPFDLDDTAMVNQFLLINKKINVDPKVLVNNTNHKKQIETWWKPTLGYWVKNWKHSYSILKHFMSYPIFVLNKEGNPMADYKDSELIVRLNVYTLLEMSKTNYEFSEDQIPVKTDEIKTELEKSLHYRNESVYYYSLCRFQHYSNQLSTEKIAQLEQSILETIDQWIAIPSKSSDIFLLLLSLSYLRPLNNKEVVFCVQHSKESSWKNHPILFCVGNKKYTNFHQYYAPALSNAIILNLFSQFSSEVFS